MRIPTPVRLRSPRLIVPIQIKTPVPLEKIMEKPVA